MKKLWSHSTNIEHMHYENIIFIICILICLCISLIKTKVPAVVCLFSRVIEKRIWLIPKRISFLTGFEIASVSFLFYCKNFKSMTILNKRVFKYITLWSGRLTSEIHLTLIMKSLEILKTSFSILEWVKSYF